MTTDTSGRTFYTDGRITLDDEQIDVNVREYAKLAGMSYSQAVSIVTRGFHKCAAPAAVRPSTTLAPAGDEDDKLETRARELQRTDPELIALTGRDAHEGYKAALRKADRELFATER